MKELDFDPDLNKFTFRFPYEAGLIEDIKALIPGRGYIAERKLWTAPVTEVTNIVTIATKHSFQYTARAYESIRNITSTTETNYKGSVAATAEIEVAGLVGELRPFQKAGVVYASQNKQVIIADEMGLGKTVQAIATIQHLNAYPCLVICPASLKLNWQREINKWLPDKEVWIMDSPFEPKDPGAFPDFCIINYDRLTKFENIIENMGFIGLVCDESHYLKNGSAKRTRATKAIAKQTPVRLLLTGTPVLNQPYELVSQLQIIDKLDEFGGWKQFTDRYCGQRDQWGSFRRGSARNLDELNRKLRQACFIRREKKDVLTELPEKQRVVTPINITNRKEYEKAEQNLIHFIYEKVLSETHDLTLALDKADKARRAEIIVGITTLKKVAALGKLDAAVEWLETFKETGEKLVIFAHHKEIINKIVEKFPGIPQITGDTPTGKRQQYVDAFQNNPDVQFIILNMQAGGVGLTLTAASNVLFLELGWTPAAHDQAEDRCHRIGQHDNVTAHYLLGEQTIDEDIYGIIQQKRSVINKITGDTNEVKTELGVINEVLGRLIKKKQ